MFCTCVWPKHFEVVMFSTCEQTILVAGSPLPRSRTWLHSIWNKPTVTFGFWGIWQERPSANSCIQVHPLILQLIWVYRLTLKKDSKMWCSQITKRWITQSLTKNVQYTWNVNTVVFLMDCIGTFCCQVKYHQCLLQTDTRTWFEVTHSPHSILRENTK